MEPDVHRPPYAREQTAAHRVHAGRPGAPSSAYGLTCTGRGDHGDPFETGRILEQDPVGPPREQPRWRCPTRRRGLRRPGPRSGAGHQRGQRPGQRGPRQLGSGLGGLADVLAPPPPTAGTPTPAHPDLQHRVSPPERFMRQPAGYAVTDLALTTATAAPVIRHRAGQHRPIRFDPLTGHHQPQPIQLSTSLEYEANPTFENEATGSWF